MNRMASTHSLAVLSLVVLASLGVGLLGCDDDRDVYYVYDYDALVNYVNTQEVAVELFRTEGLFPEQSYSRPTDPGANYIEYVDSTDREIKVTDVEEVDFGHPFDNMEFTEVRVVDNFLIRTERSMDDDVDTSYDWRSIARWGLFFRMGDTKHDYLGWVLHAFNGGGPRIGTMDARAIEDDTTFFADGRDYDDLRYLTYEYRWVLDTILNEYVRKLDTIVGYTSQPYLPLAEHARISQGDTIVFTAEGIDGANNSTGSVYQLMVAETDQGSEVSVMHAPDDATYVDTLVTPSDNPREWNVVFFREFRRPDRWGGSWVTAYRTGD